MQPLCSKSCEKIENECRQQSVNQPALRPLQAPKLPVSPPQPPPKRGPPGPQPPATQHPRPQTLPSGLQESSSYNSILHDAPVRQVVCEIALSIFLLAFNTLM